MSSVLERARRDLARDELWRARRRLEGYVGSAGYDRDVVELLGEVCWKMGDVLSAARFWFFCPADTEEKRSSIETLVRDCKGDPHVVLSRLPRRLRHAKLQRYPFEVQQRLRSLAHVKPKRRRSIVEPIRQRPRSMASDLLAFSVLSLVALFVLYCFSLGLAQILALQ